MWHLKLLFGLSWPLAMIHIISVLPHAFHSFPSLILICVSLLPEVSHVRCVGMRSYARVCFVFSWCVFYLWCGGWVFPLTLSLPLALIYIVFCYSRAVFCEFCCFDFLNRRVSSRGRSLKLHYENWCSDSN